jgi:hypothetical protein
MRANHTMIAANAAGGTAGIARRRTRLLGGTAIATGVVAAASLFSVTPALADCGEVTVGQHYECDGLNTPYGPWTFTTGADNWWAHLDGTGGYFGPAVFDDTLTINNNGDYSGTLDMDAGASIDTSGTADGLVITNTAPADSTVNVNLNGDVTTDGAHDAVSIQNGWTVNLDVNSAITGGDAAGGNGIVVTDIANLFDLTIEQDASVGAYDEAILVAGGGTPGTQVDGAATVDTDGSVTSSDNIAVRVEAMGDINVTNQTDGTIEGTGGVYLNGMANIDFANYGHVEGTDTVATVQFSSNSGDDTKHVIIKNLSTASIVGPGDGITGGSDGAPVFVYNGDGGVDNPNGAPIDIYNGYSSDSQSQIFAGGKYGIYARSRSDGAGTGAINVYNFGYVQAWGEFANAAVHEHSSADVDGYAAFYNGATAVMVAPYNPNARVDAYDPGKGGKYVAYDANGVEMIKWGGGGGLDHDINYDDGGVGSYPFGVVVKNYGEWDFSRADDYLTPGFQGGKGVAAQGNGGGIYAPEGSAIYIRHYGSDNTGVWNYGTVIGEGNSYDPVLDINTSWDLAGGGEGEVNPDGGNFLYIYNAESGLIGSVNTPSAWSLMGSSIGLADLLGNGAGYFAGSIDWSFIDASIDEGFLASFGPAAGDRLLEANWDTDSGGAPVIIDNDGLLIGQLRARTETEDTILFDNYGGWYVTGYNAFFGGPDDELWNAGVVQTAFDPTTEESTSFVGLNEYYGADGGILTMIDGGAGDETLLTGYDPVTFASGAIDAGDGRLGVDVYFGQHDDSNTKADVLTVDGNIEGSTGIVINGVNTTPGGINTWGIDVVEYSGTVEVPCSLDDGLCATGDAFYIDPDSKNYIAIGDTGAIADGVYAWYLRQDTTWSDFELVSDFGPLAYGLPGLITMAQGVWYDTDNVFDDHTNPGVGSGGPDESAMAGPSMATSRGGLWLKATGAWTDRSASVTEDVGGMMTTFDTSYNQDTYGLLGGADLKPGSDGPVRLGIFGGYVHSNGSFDAYMSDATFEGGTVGGYVGVGGDAGGFINGEVKADFLSMDYTAPIGGGVSGSANVRNLGFRANAGYRMQGARAYIEPNVSVTHVNTTIDSITAGGATLDFTNGNSTRAGAGLRVGASLGTGNGMTELSLSAKVWNEFQDANVVTITDPMTLDSATFSDGLQGVFGEVKGEATFSSADSMFKAFLGGGAVFNSDFTTVEANAGLRKNF